MSDCTLSNESFAGKVAGDAYLDAEFRCKTCGRLAGQHPAPLGGADSTKLTAERSGELQTVQTFCSRLEPNDILEANDRDIPDEGTGPLQLHRDNLVEQIISVATEGKRKQVLLRGAAGTGKTSLLAYVGRHLEAQNKRVVIAAVPDMLPKLAELLDQARKGCQEESPEEVQDRPLYLLVDEAQQSYGKGVLHALLKMHADKRNIVIIAAGIPGKEGESSAFKNRIDSDKMLLTETELCEDEEVIQFFREKLVAALGPGHPPDTTRRATIDVLKFSHYYSAGHAYACLKIAEYCVKYQAEKCIHQHQREELGLALGSEAFLGEVGKGIFKRCFPFFSDYNSVEDLRNKYMSGSTLLVSKLQEHGLWDMTRNCLLSPLLQYHLFRLVPKKDDFVFDSPSKIGHALFHCTRDYKKWKFHQYEATTEGVRERCEDGAGFFIGCELSKYCLVLPQYAIPKAQPTPGRPSSVDYYLNGRLNMFLELVNNGSLLDKHFDRFLTGSYGLEKPYAILNINFKTTEPRQLNGKYKELEENYYTYVVQTRALYRGMELFKSGQEAEPPLHISYRMAAQSVASQTSKPTKRPKTATSATDHASENSEGPVVIDIPPKSTESDIFALHRQ